MPYVCLLITYVASTFYADQISKLEGAHKAERWSCFICWKTLNHKQDLMKDIKACNKNLKLRKVDLDWSYRKSFLCSSGVQGCAQFVKERNLGFNWLFLSYTQKTVCALKRSFVQYVLFFSPKEKNITE